MYDSGMTAKEISDKISLSISSVCKILKEHGRKRRTKISGLTDDDIAKIKTLYLNGDINKILASYPSLNRPYLYCWMNKLGISCGNYYWSDSDVDILRSNYLLPTKEIYKLLGGKFSETAIKTKLQKLRLIKRSYWTQDEDDIIKQWYSFMSVDDVAKLIPNHTRKAIVTRAKLLGVTQMHRLNERYNDEQIEFIRVHHTTMTDAEMAKTLNKPLCGIREQRTKLGIYHINRDYSGYENISKLLRGQIQSWKNASMEKCNYQCVLSGSKDFVIHHLYGFNMIVQEVFHVLDDDGLLHGDDLHDYTTSELDHMIEVFHTVHDKYPLGVCVRKDIHDLFHVIYGSGCNTKGQWEVFVNNYYDGKYSEIINV